MKKLIFLLFIINIMACTIETKPTGTAGKIIENGKVTYEESTGYADLDNETPVTLNTNFRMASVSKQFTSACIILLKNDGLLTYDDPLSKFFPEFNFGNQVSLKHLLTHSSGLLDYESMIPESQTEQVSDADVLNWVANADSLYFEPGSQYKYSNSGFCILSQVVEKVSGMPYTQFIQERIFDPIAMENTRMYIKDGEIANRALGYAKNKEGMVYENDQSITSATMGDGCVYTSLNDYNKWIKVLNQNSLFNLIDEINAVARPIEQQDKLSYALGWFVHDNKELYHTGSTSGFSNVVWLDLKGKNAIIYFSNLAGNHEGVLRFLEENNDLKPEINFMEVLNLTD